MLILPSDAGTGAVKSAVDLSLKLNGDLNSIGVEESRVASLCRHRSKLSDRISCIPDRTA